MKIRQNIQFCTKINALHDGKGYGFVSVSILTLLYF